MARIHPSRRRPLTIQGATVARVTVLTVTAALFLLPFALLLRNAFMTTAELTAPEWHWLPSRWSLDTLRAVFTDPAVPFGRALLNSILVCLSHTVGVVVISGTAGYGLARFPVPYRRTITVLLTAPLLIPAALTFVPSFVMVSTLGWVSSLRGLVIPGLFQALATFLFRQYFLTFPRHLEEAAALDGLTPWGTFWRIVLPNSWGFVAAIAAITAIGSWNAFLWPLVIGQAPESWTVQVALSTYLTAQSVNLPALFTAATVAVLPMLVLFLALQRRIVHSVEHTGITGD
ncbi:L-arabinose transport system permease protein AraQ [Austwickia sp. TVS 96-490-7B]|uniref:carbohydrate ABC transporter permease n=1 Tax=Austwickia sp. TVS 96-490-7B TaxID=2830843 RepID=UPI001C55F041|nr:carbohydrate ABC transporter permease [Austwickia sp. TVS 96-490-7B]MBW3086959.1 L-arabinose transport system permease protein AraQ [Austwickia sp. TVS 96-490-7B]